MIRRDLWLPALAFTSLAAGVAFAEPTDRFLAIHLRPSPKGALVDLVFRQWDCGHAWGGYTSDPRPSGTLRFPKRMGVKRRTAANR
jgi:hypothetical protein